MQYGGFVNCWALHTNLRLFRSPRMQGGLTTTPDGSSPERVMDGKALGGTRPGSYSERTQRERPQEQHSRRGLINGRELGT